jgi:hypothetical protein
MASAQQDAPVATAGRELAALRGTCMAAAVLLIIEFGLGTGVNLYATLPKNKSFFTTVFSDGTLAAHAIVALLLLATAITAFVRAIRSRKAIVLTTIGLAAILVAAASGSSFASNHNNGSSLGMALATAVAMFCYLAAVFSIPVNTR